MSEAEASRPHVFLQRLHHEVPGWVKAGASFHVRLRSAAPGSESSSLTATLVGTALLASARYYHEIGRWHCRLFLLMPDHCHAILSFPRDKSMARVIGDWKRYTTSTHSVRWQANFFDHRLRHEGEADQTWHYVRRNPVVKNLCASEDDWPWVWWPQRDQQTKT